MGENEITEMVGRFNGETGEPSDSPHFRSRLAPLIGDDTAFHLCGRLQKMYWNYIGASFGCQRSSMLRSLCET